MMDTKCPLQVVKGLIMKLQKLMSCLSNMVAVATSHQSIATYASLEVWWTMMGVQCSFSKCWFGTPALWCFLRYMPFYGAFAPALMSCIDAMQCISLSPIEFDLLSPHVISFVVFLRNLMLRNMV